MAIQVKMRRGTTAEHATFTGAIGEVTVNTTTKQVVVHDGGTPGGFPAALSTHGHAAFGGATALAAGGAGFVPAPAAGQQNFVLFGDGTWKAFSGLPVIANGDALKLTRVRADEGGYESFNADEVFARVDGANISAGIKNRLLNGGFAIDQRRQTSIADAAYGLDRWYCLVDGGNVTIAQQTDQEPGSPFSIRLTQPDVSAKRLGLAQAIESVLVKDLRGLTVTFSGRVRSSVSQPIRFAILEHTGTSDTITRDVVNNWASSVYTAGNFFIAGVNVLQAGSFTPGANAWSAFPKVTATVGASAQNLIVVIWTEASFAQNATLDLARLQLEQGGTASAFERRDRASELALCERYFEKSYELGVTPTASTSNGQGMVGGHVWYFNGSTLQIGAICVSWRQAKRVAPTVTLYDRAGTSARYSRRIGAAWADALVVATPLVSERGFVLDGTSDAMHVFVHYTANAEL